ncbi:MAG: hypothetical protein ABFS16_00615 [Bacteroidota bacterium]
MIKSKIKIHDKFSIVIDVTFDKIFKRKKSKYTTITYLFIPDSLNINNKTYPPTKFYNDSRLFLKYDTPNYNLDDIHSGEKSLLGNLERNTGIFIKKRSHKNHSRVKDQVKMFATTFSSLVRTRTDSLIKKKKLSDTDINEFLNKTELILSEFRVIISTIKEAALEDINVVFYADEHMSNVVELQLMKLFNHLQKIEFKVQVLDKVVALINLEQNYKKQTSYDSPKDKNVKPEELLYKRNQLKKYIENVFFLQQDVRKDGTFLEQTLLALAAGLAMVFSTGIAFYYQQVYGNLTLPFFVALVISYMLKDRIKGLGSRLFVSKSSSLFYNFKVKITNSLNKRIGVIKENFAFVGINKLGPNIKKHRQKDLIVKMSLESLHEQVIQYKKKIYIHPKRFGDDLPDENIIGMTDVTRLNFHRFIQYMDDPKKDYILVKKGEVYNKVANKFYHINIIQKYYTEEGIEFSRYRVIMNRNGIRRIEKVALEE